MNPYLPANHQNIDDIEEWSDEPYCTCNDSHLCVPEDISSGHCVYCKKPTYAIFKKNYEKENN